MTSRSHRGSSGSRLGCGERLFVWRDRVRPARAEWLAGHRDRRLARPDRRGRATLRRRRRAGAAVGVCRSSRRSRSGPTNERRSDPGTGTATARRRDRSGALALIAVSAVPPFGLPPISRMPRAATTYRARSVGRDRPTTEVPNPRRLGLRLVVPRDSPVDVAEMPACSPEQERRSRPGIVVSRTSAEAALRGRASRAILPPRMSKAGRSPRFQPKAAACGEHGDERGNARCAARGCPIVGRDQAANPTLLAGLRACESRRGAGWGYRAGSPIAAPLQAER
jgi:hypothetical protein